MAAKKIDRRIVVLQRGWVVVGDWSRKGDDVSLDRAAVIRRWGTKNGLGQLAATGATSDTVLEPCGQVLTHLGAVIATIPLAKGVTLGG